MIKTIKELYAYREMIAGLVRRDLRGRYKGSVLGFLWTFINPLLQLGIYTMVFSFIMRSNIDQFYIFLFVVLIPWLFFASGLVGGSSCIVSQTSLITKIYFPREVLPIAYVTSAFVNMLLVFIVIFLVLIISGFGINFYALLYLPLIMIIEYIMVLGITFLVSSITVYLRDMEHILGMVAMAWQFLTPVLYSLDVIPEEVLPVFLANPMTSIIVAYRDILYYKQAPQLNTLITATTFGVVILLIGILVFSKLKKRFAEEL